MKREPFSIYKKGNTSDKLNDKIPVSKVPHGEHTQPECQMKQQDPVVRKGGLHSNVPISGKDTVPQKKDDASTLPTSKVKKLPTVTHQATNFFDG